MAKVTHFFKLPTGHVTRYSFGLVSHFFQWVSLRSVDVFDIMLAAGKLGPLGYFYDRERKCADTIVTVIVPWAGYFQC